MARVLVFVPDLLFGSKVMAAVQAAGHEPVLVTDLDQGTPELPGAELLIVDLTTEASQRIARASALEGVPKLAFYSHVEADVRTAAEQAGFELVVPRSRMARDGAALVSRLLSD